MMFFVGAHNDVALGDGGAHVGDCLGGGHTCSSCLVDGCLMMAWGHDVYGLLSDGCGWNPLMMMAWSHDASFCSVME